jgi:hypothetical protein
MKLKRDSVSSQGDYVVTDGKGWEPTTRLEALFKATVLHHKFLRLSISTSLSMQRHSPFAPSQSLSEHLARPLAPEETACKG